MLDTTYLLESTILSWTHWLRAYPSTEPNLALHQSPHPLDASRLLKRYSLRADIIQYYHKSLR